MIGLGKKNLSANNIRSFVFNRWTSSRSDQTENFLLFSYSTKSFFFIKIEREIFLETTFLLMSTRDLACELTGDQRLFLFSPSFKRQSSSDFRLKSSFFSRDSIFLSSITFHWSLLWTFQLFSVDYYSPRKIPLENLSLEVEQRRSEIFIIVIRKENLLRQELFQTKRMARSENNVKKKHFSLRLSNRVTTF